MKAWPSEAKALANSKGGCSSVSPTNDLHTNLLELENLLLGATESKNCFVAQGTIGY